MEFQSFDTWDEAMAAINEARQAADGRVKPWQAAIKAGDYFVQGTEYDFLIFGQVLESDDEYYQSEEGKHFRFCRCFSVACPDSESGDVHVSVIGLVITEEVFNRFKDKGWVVEEGDSFS